MMTPDQVDRVAHVAAILRPDWPLVSLTTWLAGFAERCPHRTFVPTLHAVIDVACDPASKTLARLEQQGPWWGNRAVEAATPTPPRLCRVCWLPEHGPCLRPPRDEAIVERAKATIRSLHTPKGVS